MDKSTKPAKVVIKKFDLDGVIADFKTANTAEEAAAGWKINKGNMSELLTKMVDQYVDGEWAGYDKEWKSAIEYFDSNGVNEGALQKAIFSGLASIKYSRYSYSSAPLNRLVSRVETLLNSGLFNLFKVGKSNKNLTDVLVKVRDKILNNAQAMSTLQELDSYKKSVYEFLNSSLVKNSLNDPTGSLPKRAVYYYLANKPVNEFFSNYPVQREFTRNSDGTYSFDYDNYNDTPSLSIILKSFGVTKANPASIVIKNIESGYRFKWDDFEEDALKNTQDELKSIKNNDTKRYERIANYVLKNYNYDQTTAGAGWNEIVVMAAENIDIKNLINELTDTYSAIKIETLPNNIKSIILKRIGEYLKTKPLSTGVDNKRSYGDNSTNNRLSTLFKLSRLFESANMIEPYKKIISDEYVTLIKLATETSARYITDPFDSTVPNSRNTLATYISPIQQNEIDSRIIDAYPKNDITITGPISFYGNMSPENKKKVLGYIKDGFFLRFRPITDKNLLDDINPKDFVKNVGSVEALIPLNFDTTEYMDKILALPESKEKIDGIFKNLTRNSDMYGARKILTTVLKSKQVSATELSDYANKFISNVEGDGTYHLTAIVNDLQSDSFDKKDAILLEKSLTYIDKNLSKLKNDYKEFMTSAQPAFVDYANFDRASAEKMYWTMTPSMKKRMASSYMSNREFAGFSALSAIQSGVIAPFEKLTETRIKQNIKIQ